MGRNAFGVVFSGNYPLERILQGAQLAERLGFDSCWLGEDFFYHGGIAVATAIACNTSRITIGLGVLSPLPRHPALTAMEVGTLDQLTHGRLIFGVGYGVPAWMRQMGLGCRSSLSAMREGVELVRRLLAGEQVTYNGICFVLDRVRLGFTPYRSSIPIYLGVEGPKALQLSGEIADGTVISILSSPEYLEFARENIAIGCKRGGRSIEAHRLVVYVIFSMDENGERARQAVRYTIAEYLGAGGRPTPLTRYGGVPDELMELMGAEYRSGRIPVELVSDELVSRLAVAGTPEECVTGIQRLLACGAHEIVFFPLPSSEAEAQIERISQQLLPRLLT